MEFQLRSFLIFISEMFEQSKVWNNCLLLEYGKFNQAQQEEFLNNSFIFKLQIFRPMMNLDFEGKNYLPTKWSITYNSKQRIIVQSQIHHSNKKVPRRTRKFLFFSPIWIQNVSAPQRNKMQWRAGERTKKLTPCTSAVFLWFTIQIQKQMDQDFLPISRCISSP